MLKIDHYGLYFNRDAVVQAQKNKNRSPYEAAWKLLNNTEHYELLAQTLWNGLRCRLNEDALAGSKAVTDLQNEQLNSLDAQAPYLSSLMRMLAAAQAFETVRDHPALTPQIQDDWLKTFSSNVQQLSYPPENASYPEQIWLSTLNAAAGVVLEDQALLDSAAQVYRQVIDHDIHPRGYIAAVVENQNSYHNFVLTVKGLTLIAEITKHAGIDLWNYHNRGVSIATAGLYPLYYYYYPEKWLWAKDLQIEEAQQVFDRHGSYLELLNHHIGRTTQAIDLILAELRPVFDVYGGGLTTLTHAVPQKRGIFG